MPGLDVSRLSPDDAVAALRSYPRRFREVLTSVEPDDVPAEAVEAADHVARSVAMLAEALRQVVVQDNPTLLPAVADDTAREWTMSTLSSPDDVLAFLDMECNAMADAVHGVASEAWTRTGIVAGTGTEMSALAIAREAVRTGAITCARQRARSSCADRILRSPDGRGREPDNSHGGGLVHTHSNRLVALALAALLLVAACGGGGSQKASSTDGASTNSETTSSSSKTASVQGRQAATALNAARKKADTASAAPFKDLQAAFKSQDLAALKSAQAQLRDIDFAFDKEVRSVLFPDDVANERNTYLKDNGDVIAAEDAGQNAATVADFDQTNLRAGRISTKRGDDAFALLRALGVPDLQDNGHPDAPAPDGQVVLKDDFSNASSGWFTGSKTEGTFAYAANKYQMTSAAIGTAMFSDSNLSGASADPALTSLDGVSVEVDVTETKPRVAPLVSTVTRTKQARTRHSSSRPRASGRSAPRRTQRSRRWPPTAARSSRTSTGSTTCEWIAPENETR